MLLGFLKYYIFFYPNIIFPEYPFYPILDFCLFLKMGERIYKLNFMLLHRGPTNKFTLWYLSNVTEVCRQKF